MTYHFHVHDGTTFYPDDEGSRLTAYGAAREEARLIARDLLQDGFRSGEDRLDWRLQVVDPAGIELFAYTLARAAA